jgi:signal transduction histidine kinase/ActR/RegA family two-component response regulator
MDPVRAEAIRTLYLQLRNSAAAAGIVTLYMAGTAASFTPWPVIAGWAAVQVATQVMRGGLYRAWQRADVPDEKLERWALAYTAYMALAGLVWGSTIFLFAHPDEPITVALTLCGLYGISSGSVPGNAYNPPGLYAFVGLIFAAVLARLLATGDFDYVVLGLASAGFALIMIGFCRVQARTIAEGFRIRFENRELLEALGIQKAEAEESRRRAEGASLAKSQFLAAASHDLRQPLYALSLFSASLDELRLDGAGRKVVGDIQRSVTTLEQLFDGLLDISRLEAGVVQPRIGPVAIDPLFDRLSQYHRPIAIERGLDLRFRSDGDTVLSDAALLEQVLSNLVGNALRYTETGAVLVAARRRGGQLRFEVWDTGIGIAEGDRVRIFEEFVQIGNAERDRRKGLGLGLSIARRAAALIGARMDVASRPGRGSRFAFAQPLTDAVADAAKSPAAPIADVQPELPILIVEDDREVRRALGDLLLRWGVTGELMADGDSALARIRAGARYVLLIADHRLPGTLDGLTLIARAREADPDLPATLVTADFDAALVAAAAERAIPLLHKPLRPEALRALINGASRQDTAGTE